MNQHTVQPAGSRDEARRQQQRSALRTALVMASIAVVFFFGIMVKQYVFGN